MPTLIGINSLGIKTDITHVRLIVIKPWYEAVIHGPDFFYFSVMVRSEASIFFVGHGTEFMPDLRTTVLVRGSLVRPKIDQMGHFQAIFRFTVTGPLAYL